MSMSKFATYAEYAASVQPINRDATLDRITAMAAEAAADAQLKLDARRWNQFLASCAEPDWWNDAMDAEIAARTSK